MAAGFSRISVCLECLLWVVGRAIRARIGLASFRYSIRDRWTSNWPNLRGERDLSSWSRLGTAPGLRRLFLSHAESCHAASRRRRASGVASRDRPRGLLPLGRSSAPSFIDQRSTSLVDMHGGADQFSETEVTRRPCRSGTYRRKSMSLVSISSAHPSG